MTEELIRKAASRLATLSCHSIRPSTRPSWFCSVLLCLCFLACFQDGGIKWSKTDQIGVGLSDSLKRNTLLPRHNQALSGPWDNETRKSISRATGTMKPNTAFWGNGALLSSAFGSSKEPKFLFYCLSRG